MTKMKNEDENEFDDDYFNEDDDETLPKESEYTQKQIEYKKIFNAHEEKYGRTFDAGDLEFLDGFDQKYPEKKYDVLREDIGGLDAILEQFEVFKMGIEHADMYTFMGAEPPNGFVLHGPSGTGKTYIAKYLAKEMNARFVDIPLERFESKWVGEPAKNISNILMELVYRYCITGEKNLLFFDEMEEVYKDRREMGWHGPRVNVLLREMDGLGNNNGIIFSGATNYIEKVDTAALRPGRFDFVIKIPDYGPNELADVVRATANRRNRTAPHHDPFLISVEESKYLGELAYALKMTPAAVNESFRRAAETRIRKLCLDKRQAFDNVDIFIFGHDIEKIMLNYIVPNENEKRPIVGFKT